MSKEHIELKIPRDEAAYLLEVLRNVHGTAVSVPVLYKRLGDACNWQYPKPSTIRFGTVGEAYLGIEDIYRIGKENDPSYKTGWQKAVFIDEAPLPKNHIEHTAEQAGLSVPPRDGMGYLVVLERGKDYRALPSFRIECKRP